MNMGGWYLKHQFQSKSHLFFSRIFLNLLRFADLSHEEVHFCLSSLELIADLIVHGVFRGVRNVSCYIETNLNNHIVMHSTCILQI